MINNFIVTTVKKNSNMCYVRLPPHLFKKGHHVRVVDIEAEIENIGL